MTPIPLVTDVTCHTYYKELFPLHIVNNGGPSFASCFLFALLPASVVYPAVFSSHSASEVLYIAWCWLRWLSSSCSLHLYLYTHSHLPRSLPVYPTANPRPRTAPVSVSEYSFETSNIYPSIPWISPPIILGHSRLNLLAPGSTFKSGMISTALEPRSRVIIPRVSPSVKHQLLLD